MCSHVCLVLKGAETGGAEIASQSQLGGVITTGGGFSTLFAMPSWQSDAVTSYLEIVQTSAKPPVKGYNSQGRAYPDVSLSAYNYIIVAGGENVGLYGTSASTPVISYHEDTFSCD